MFFSSRPSYQPEALAAMRSAASAVSPAATKPAKHSLGVLETVRPSGSARHGNPQRSFATRCWRAVKHRAE